MPAPLPDFDYVITRPDGRGFDLAVEVCCERCDGPSLVLTGATVARVPHGARRLDFALPCDCPTWTDHAVTLAKGAGFIAACAIGYVFIVGIMLL
jgi:hypothetical protein